LLQAGQAQDTAEPDTLRRIWNEKFKKAREQRVQWEAATKKKATASKAKTSTNKTKKTNQPDAMAGDTRTEDFVGVTIWRLRAASPAGGKRDVTRLLVPGSRTEFQAERVSGNTAFSRDDLLRLSIEVPREQDNYLYVIDREMYADGSFSEPYLIFPVKTINGGNNRIAAGRIVDLPAQDDPRPYFRFESSRPDHAGERLTILITPQPLDVTVGDGPVRLDLETVQQWEKLWSRPAERHEQQASVGQTWTAAEKEAGAGKRILKQSDPLPQTIYRLKGQAGGVLMVNLPLRTVP
jgi:hypothetical protein